MPVLKEVPKEDAEVKTASQLPKPVGYKILIALPEIEEKTEGGVIKPDYIRDVEEYSTVTGFVLSMGPDCFQDAKRFPSGPYCKEGDWICFRAFQGTRLKIHGKEFRLINDDTVEAVVEDPRGIKRA
jgi:co-chaperonin GroES (HSP10)|tara:strand:- start:255 stop:635 length:381 start_codon:yes stop_codon:yes gene_type:complete